MKLYQNVFFIFTGFMMHDALYSQTNFARSLCDVSYVIMVTVTAMIIWKKGNYSRCDLTFPFQCFTQASYRRPGAGATSEPDGELPDILFTPQQIDELWNSVVGQKENREEEGQNHRREKRKVRSQESYRWELPIQYKIDAVYGEQTPTFWTPIHHTRFIRP